jgi:hypothetical protein
MITLGTFVTLLQDVPSVRKWKEPIIAKKLKNIMVQVHKAIQKCDTRSKCNLQMLRQTSPVRDLEDEPVCNLPSRDHSDMSLHTIASFSDMSEAIVSST